MKLKNLPLAVLAIVLTCCSSVLKGNQNTGSLLWKISGKGLEKPSYILGTFHLKSGTYLDSIPGARTALESCEQVIGELTMNDMAGMQIQMQQAMMMDSDTTYQMLYSENDYQFVDDQLKTHFNAGLDQFGIVKPAAINLTLTMMAYQQYFPDTDMTNVLDIYIQKEASKKGKTVKGLETIEHQIDALLNSSNLQRQADILLCNLKNTDFMLSQVTTLIDYYNKADLTSLYRLMDDMNDPCPGTEYESDMLLKNRNDSWMQQLPAMMKEKSSFIAVGAMHLAGDTGILNQLEKAGYKVEAVQ